MNRILLVSICCALIAAKTNLRASSFIPTPASSPYNGSTSSNVVRDYLKEYGYPFEEHHATTEDGYILTLWRIPCRKHVGDKCTPIFFQHGVEDTGFSFLFQDIDKNLPIKLYHEGYDLWFGNIRGNRYSLAHTHLNPLNYSGPYWEFSYDEMAKYDLPAMLNHVKAVTKAPNIKYVCHSQGCAILVALGTLNPQYVSSVVNTTVAFAPAVYIQYQHSTVFVIARWLKIIGPYIRSGLKTFLVGAEWHSLIKYTGLLIPKIFMDLLSCGVGAVDSPDIDLRRVPILAEHLPGGTSLNNMLHFLQASSSKTFKMLDFGKEENLKRYGQEEAPDYDMKNWGKIDMRWRVVFGEKDAFIPKEGIIELVKWLDKKGNVEVHEVLDANHLDLYFADYASETVFPDVIDFIKDSGN